MRVFKGLSRLPLAGSSVVCVGVFDAVHRGHRAIIRAAIRAAKRRHCPSVVLTLYPHPSAVLNPSNAVPLILTLEQRLERIAEENPDYCVVLPFNRRLAQMPARRFFDRVLLKRLKVRGLCVGRDFRFGAGGAGNTESLKEWGGVSGVKVDVIAPVLRRGVRVSSSCAREWIREGRVDGTRDLLGRYPEWRGRVVRGDGIARMELQTPTLNLRIQNELFPAFGVYAGRVGLEGEKRKLGAVIHAGPRPTFKDPARRFEIHVLNQSVRWRGRRIRVELCAFLRKIKKFDSPAHLKSQIHRDRRRAAMLIEKIF